MTDMYTKIPPPQGWFAPHRCAICNGRFEEWQQFYNYGHGEVVHFKCFVLQRQNKAAEDRGEGL